MSVARFVSFVVLGSFVPALTPWGAVAEAQEPLQVLTGSGSSPLPGFGFSVAATGDIDQDGTPDVIVGAPYEGQTHKGQAKVFSGASGALLLPVLANAQGSYFGWSVAGVGDVNGDGFLDVAVGDPQFNFLGPGGKGTLDVFSGAFGELLLHVEGTAASDEFGATVAAAGDVNGDGFPDIAVGASQSNDTAQGPGYVRIVSGHDGSTLRTYTQTGAGKRYGQSLANAGDVNGDGRPDLLIGASGWNRVELRSGIDGALLWFATAGAGVSSYGWAVAAGAASPNGADVNGDGQPDVLIGAPNPGRVEVRDAATGQLHHTFVGPAGDSFGGAVAIVGDVEGDGFADVLIGAKWADAANGTPFTGKAWIFSGHEHQEIRSFEGHQNGDRMGYAVAALGDLDHDGYPDVALGATQEISTSVGYVELQSGRTPLVPFTQSISIATGGAQVLSLAAGPAHANQAYAVLGSLSGTSPGISLTGTPVPLNFDAYTLLTLTSPNVPVAQGFGTLDAQGNAIAVFALPPGLPPTLAGLTLHHAYVSHVNGLVTQASNAVACTLTP